ncbi:MAG: hypothetical protein HZC36_05770 [Armatimonadetes bacterium]|nr:hypothetical protein [Armatimonadota bacterium]
MAEESQVVEQNQAKGGRRAAKIAWGVFALVVLAAAGWVLYDPAIEEGLIPPEPEQETGYYIVKDIEAELATPVPNPPILPPIQPGQKAADYEKLTAPLWAPYRKREQERKDRLYAKLKEVLRLPFRLPEAEKERIARRDAAAFLGDISQLRPDQVADSGLTMQNIPMLLGSRINPSRPDPDIGLDACVTALQLEAKFLEDGGFAPAAGSNQAAYSAIQQFPMWIPKASLSALADALRRMRAIPSRAAMAAQTFRDERNRQLRFIRAFTAPVNWRRQMVSNFEMPLKDAIGIWLSHRNHLAKQLSAYHDGWKRLLDTQFANTSNPPKWPEGPVFYYLSLRDGTKVDAHIAYWQTLKYSDLNLAFVCGALSLEVYKRRFGHYPSHAEAMKQSLYLPGDPFGTGVLHYALKGDGYLLYSVGPDGKDDQGVPAGMIRSTLSSGLYQSYALNDRGDVLYMGSNFDLVAPQPAASERPVIRSKSTAD